MSMAQEGGNLPASRRAVTTRATTAPPPGLARSNALRAACVAAALALLCLILLLSVAVGSRSIPPDEVLRALFAYDDSDTHAIIWSLRLPRTLLGLFVGASLGLSGALIQAMTRNPLADPGILGVNAGAAFFVVLAVGFLGLSSIHAYIWFALAGAVVTTVFVYAVGSVGRAGATPARLTLAGVATAAVLSGITSGLALINPEAFDKMRHWGAGSIATPGYTPLLAALPFLLAGLALAFAMARPLNAVALGDDLAASLGANVKRTRTVVVVAVTLLAGAATAAAGPIGFVGLMVPHVARWIAGPDQRWIFALTAVLSPVLLLGSDIVGRIVLRPAELQVGIVTAFIGAPVLIFLARRRMASGL